MGVLDRFNINKLKEGLSKTRDAIVARVTKLVTARGTIDEVSLEQLEEILIGADVGTGATSEIIAALRKRVGEQRYSTPAELIGLLKEVLQGEIVPVAASAEIPAAVTSGPYVIMVVGVNGAGKTTTIGKLAHQYVSEGKSVVIGAADTFRAAANEQLEIWAQRSGAKLIRQQQGSDPAAVAFDAVHSAIAQKADVVIIDTAGRLHTKVNLMEELRKIRRVIEKVIPGSPHEVLLVIDASTGQNGLQQAKQFGAAVGITGLVLTKLDGTSKGGVVLAIVREMNIPIRFIGVGEGLGDLQPFDKTAFVDALFDLNEAGQ
jgi:fused signal recognition particle receptor